MLGPAETRLTVEQSSAVQTAGRLSVCVCLSGELAGCWLAGWLARWLAVWLAVYMDVCLSVCLSVGLHLELLNFIEC